MTAKRFIDRLKVYARLTRLERPIGSLLLLWPTLWALWIASDGTPSRHNIIVFVLGVLAMRSAGCVANDFADRDIDGHVKRTTNRPLATGECSTTEAVGLFFALTSAAFILVLTTNALTVKLAFVAIVLACIYPYMKRHTHLPQVVLGAAFGWAVPMAFAAETNMVAPVGWLLFIGVVVWAVVYDTMYAMVDRDDDLKIGLKSTAILFGDADRTWIGVFQLTFFVVLLVVGNQAKLGAWYHGGLFVAMLLAVYHQYLIRHRERQACLRAFVHNNWLGAVIFCGILADYGWRRVAT